MGTYADSLLTQGEVVIRRERQHWLSLFLETRLSILLWIIAILAVFSIPTFKIRGALSDGISIASPDRHRRGHRVLRLPLLALEDGRVRHHQSPAAQGGRHHQQALGRLQPGEDQRRHPGGEPRRPAAGLRRPGDPDRGGGVGRPVPDAQPRQDLQEGDDDRQARAGGRSLLPRRGQRAAAGQQRGSRHATGDHRRTERADTPEEISQSLTRLATLRDSGAITDADYEAKKQELLGRL